MWGKFSLPTLSQQAINARLTKRILLYEKNQRRPKKDFLNGMQSIFDITKVDGVGLCREDRGLYYKQVESGEKVRYTTHKPAPQSSIHPSKRWRHAPISNEQFANTSYMVGECRALDDNVSCETGNSSDESSNMESDSGTLGDNISSETEDRSDEPKPVTRKKSSAIHTRPQN